MNIFLRLAAKLAFGALVLTQTPAYAAGSDYPLDRFPTTKLTEQAALQEGAKLFVNYCLGCHSAQYMRYNRLRDIGLTDDQIKRNLLFSADKVGEGMKIRALNAGTGPERPPGAAVVKIGQVSPLTGPQAHLLAGLLGRHEEAAGARRGDPTERLEQQGVPQASDY